MEKPEVQRPRRRPVSPSLTIEIEQGTIDNSVRRDAAHCMISEAIHQKLPLARNIETDLSTIRWTDPVKRLRYIYFTPKEAQRYLLNFDQGIPPQPFQLRLKRAAKITRGAGGKSNMKTADERKEANRRNQRLARSLTTSDGEQLFGPSIERREEVIRAMDDPTAPLGPATIFDPSGGCSTSIPVVVGGRPPLPGQLAHKRRFGLRQMIE